LQYTGELIHAFANAWDAADAMNVKKIRIIKICEANPIFDDTIPSKKTFLNAVQGCAFQFMQDD